MKYVIADSEERAKELAEKNYIFSSRKELDFVISKYSLNGLKIYKVYDGCLGLRVFSQSQIGYKIKIKEPNTLEFKKPKLPDFKNSEALDTQALDWLKEKGFRQ